MSYMGPDPGNVEHCPICGEEIFPYVVCEDPSGHMELSIELSAQARANIEAMLDGPEPDDDPFDLPF